MGIYLALSLMWFVIDLLDDSSGYWFYWPMLGTGVAVLVTGVALGGIGGLFGQDWERRQIEKRLDQTNPSVGGILGPDRRRGPMTPEPGRSWDLELLGMDAAGDGGRRTVATR